MRTIPPTSVNQEIKTLGIAAIRRAISSVVGTSFAGNRDLYDALGYKRNPDFDDFFGRYKFQDVAKRIVEAYPDATWTGRPQILGPNKESNELTAVWKKLARKLKIFHYFNRVDVLAGIGEYAVLFLGFDDGKPLDQPVTQAKELLYLSPYSSKSAEVESLEEDIRNPRYGLPKTYRIQMSVSAGSRSIATTRTVHWTRVLHIAEGLLEDEIYGTPRLESVFNRLEDLARVAGGSAEMFWRGAFPGLAFSANDGAKWTQQSIDEFSDEVEEYFQGLKRYLRMTDAQVQQLNPQSADPSNHIKVLLELISGAEGIPLRILIGSERGELASTQDESNWLSRVQERRTDFGEDVVMRPFIDRLMSVGVLKQAEYEIVWPDLKSLSLKDQADIGKVRSETLGFYIRAGGESLMHPEDFLVRFLGVSQEEVPAILQRASQYMQEEAVLAQREATAQGELSGEGV